MKKKNKHIKTDMNDHVRKPKVWIMLILSFVAAYGFILAMGVLVNTMPQLYGFTNYIVWIALLILLIGCTLSLLSYLKYRKHLQNAKQEHVMQKQKYGSVGSDMRTN